MINFGINLYYTVSPNTELKQDMIQLPYHVFYPTHQMDPKKNLQTVA
jgi:hypothetical protein